MQGSAGIRDKREESRENRGKSKCVTNRCSRSMRNACSRRMGTSSKSSERAVRDLQEHTVKGTVRYVIERLGMV